MPYEEIAVDAAGVLQRNEVEVSGDLDARRPETVLHLGLGRSVTVPTELLLTGMASGGDAAPQQRGALNPGSRSAGDLAAAGRDTVIPLVAEQMQVGKETVTTGKVRLHRDVETYTESASLPLTRTSWDVQRTPVGEVVAEKPEVRQEGEVMIFPLVEERIVAKREYFLIEEVRVRQVATTSERTTSLELKRDVLTVERE